MSTATTVTGGKHGTKWIGGVLTGLSAISAINPAMVPPSWLPYIAGLGGLATLLRGFVNSSNQDPPASS